MTMPQGSGRRWVVVSLLLATVVVAGLWSYSAWNFQREDDHDVDGSMIDQGNGEVSQPAMNATPSARPDGLAQALVHLPLPAADLPLKQQLNALMVRAEAGDPVAACRLAMESARCKRVARSRSMATEVQRSLEARQTDSDEIKIGVVARAEERVDASAAFCAEVDASALPGIDELPSRAIANLDPRQKTLLALLRSDGQVRRLDMRQNAQLSESTVYVLPQLIADNTQAFLLEGFNALDPLALEGLIILHAPGNSLPPMGMRVALPNPRAFAHYALLQEQLFGSASLGRAAPLLAEVLSTLSADEIARTRALVSTELARWRSVPDVRAPSASMTAEWRSRAELCGQ